jgi:hypothetical protein
MGLHATDQEAMGQVPQVRLRAFELSPEELAEMLTMHWRIQVVATWFAIARREPALSGAVHIGFERCQGTLTLPGFVACMLTYPNPTTAIALRRYRQRAIVENLGGDYIVSAGLRRLEEEGLRGDRGEGDHELSRLLDVAGQLQRRS